MMKNCPRSAMSVELLGYFFATFPMFFLDDLGCICSSLFSMDFTVRVWQRKLGSVARALQCRPHVATIFVRSPTWWDFNPFFVGFFGSCAGRIAFFTFQECAMAAFSKSQKCARHHSIVQVEQHKGHMRHSKTTYDLKISSTFLRIVKVSPKTSVGCFWINSGFGMGFTHSSWSWDS